MQKFKDSKGEEWSIDVNTLTLTEVNEACGVLLTELYDDDCKLLNVLSTDAIKLAQVVRVLTFREARERGIDEVEFASRLIGDAIREARVAVARSVNDFFDHPARREAANKALDALLTLEDKTHERLVSMGLKALAEVDLDQAADGCMSSVLSMRESRASSPGASRQAS